MHSHFMHSLWKGSITFGLVNIPVKLYTATQTDEISFTLLHKKDHSKIRYARICKSEEKEVPWKDIVKGYEYEEGDFVIFDDKDFEKINLKKTRTIEIIQFIDQEEIDSVYYVKPYFLEPEKNGERAYGLLRDALKKAKKVGLAKYILRNREHLAVIKFHGDALILNELRYESELAQPKDLKFPKSKVNPKEMAIAIQLIDQLTAPFQPKKYKDTFTQEIKQAIKKKARGRPIHPKTDAPRSTKVHDIMSLLEESLEKAPQKRRSRKGQTKRGLPKSKEAV